jgi:hypothetical protein
VHHYRVALSGPPAATAAVVAELRQPAAATHLVLAREEGIDFWESLSRRHRMVAFGIEYFEELEDELLHVVIHAGETTEMSRTSLLPRYRVWLDDDDGDLLDGLSDEAAELIDWFEDDDEGEPMDKDRVRMAANLISAARLRYTPHGCDDGLTTALELGKALGRLCQRTERTAHTEPSPVALEAVIEMAVYALGTSGSSEPSAAERDFRQALALTQSTTHAASDRYYHEAWGDWLRILIGSVSNTIDAATSPLVDGSGLEVHPLATEHYSSGCETLDLEARSLLTTCVQALALFGEAHRAIV